MSKFQRKIFEISGTVQGVGFRPAIYNLATHRNLGGSVKNSSGLVTLILEGDSEAIDSFLLDLPENLPRQAKIESIKLLSQEDIREDEIVDFVISMSSSGDDYRISIPADLAVCEDCLREISNPADRRYKYPFTTCVNCGPRYTVVNTMPYDRCRTTLVSFPLCEDCLKEYQNPSDRRFHAESIACPKCGPSLTLYDSEFNKIYTDTPLDEFKKLIKAGCISAVKGIGGFQIAADAMNSEAVDRLRIRKNRPHKPFALMAGDISVIRRFCSVSFAEEMLLKSPAAPIVILKIRADIAETGLPLKLISPDTDTIGFMLCASPLHYLMLEDELEVILLTSGNKRGEPICIKNEEAFQRLSGIADVFLCHDRDINLRNDDSVCVCHEEIPQVWRRARGFSPDAIKVKNFSKKNILAMGAELKNTITLLYGNEAVISPHIGDLETPEAYDALIRLSETFPAFHKKTPEFIVCDLHPDMHSKRLAEKISAEMKLPLLRVQHHHAHAVSCMAENGIEEAIALVFDGTGLGADNVIWGSELLYVNTSEYERMGTFVPSALPGGDTAVFNPKRQLFARYLEAGVKEDDIFPELFNASNQELSIWRIQCERGVNAPLSHACGRLFDSVGAMLGLMKESVTYEGQLPIRVENEAVKAADKLYASDNLFEYKVKYDKDLIFIDWSETFRNFSPGMLRKTFSQNNSGVLIRKYAYDFHVKLADCALTMISHAIDKKGHIPVVLSGGVFMNKSLTGLILQRASEQGIEVYIHRNVPPNDGGISLGQAVIASYSNF